MIRRLALLFVALVLIGLVTTCVLQAGWNYAYAKEAEVRGLSYLPDWHSNAWEGRPASLGPAYSLFRWDEAGEVFVEVPCHGPPYPAPFPVRSHDR